nr:hypothetical protein [Clostridium cibarium]
MRDRKYKNVRPDLIILDDYQSEDDVRIEVAREKKWKRYSDDKKKLYDEISQSISNILHYKEMKICINLFA